MPDEHDPPVAEAEPIRVTDWVSAVCSAIAAIIALITLVTVYVAARQLLTEHKAYQLGLSHEALGPWHTKVKRKRLLGLQQTIVTPVISIAHLVKQHWEPNITFPTGFQVSACQEASQTGNGPDRSTWEKTLRVMGLIKQDSNKDGIKDVEKAPARATWVNFMQALNIGPEDDHLYRMHTQSELVSGIVPMRWAGKELCAIA
jgi:hypothetical protein